MIERVDAGPADWALMGESLVTVLTFVVVGVGVFLLPDGNPARVALALFGVLVVPGYAVSTLVFPARDETSLTDSRHDGWLRSDDTGVTAPTGDPLASEPAGSDRTAAGSLTDRFLDADWPADTPGGVTDVERAALSVGLSVALLPLYGWVIATLQLEFELLSIVRVIATAATGFLLLGTVRRATVDPAHRYTLPIGSWLDRLRDAESAGLSPATVAVTVALIVASASLLGGFAAPRDGSTYTQVSLLTDRGGELTAGPYQTSFEQGEQTGLTLRLTNREGGTVEYTVFVLVQRLDDDGSVVESKRLHRFDRTMAAGETARIDHTVTAALTGDRVRFSYLVYEGEPPATIDAESADEHLWLSVDVS